MPGPGQSGSGIPGCGNLSPGGGGRGAACKAGQGGVGGRHLVGDAGEVQVVGPPQGDFQVVARVRAPEHDGGAVLDLALREFEIERVHGSSGDPRDNWQKYMRDRLAFY